MMTNLNFKGVENKEIEECGGGAIGQIVNRFQLVRINGMATNIKNY